MDFRVFFPTLPEADYAQLQVAMAHYRQMEKPDRDRTQAREAEDAFQTFLEKFPNDPLADKAAQHLREVQEVLAEGDFRIGYFYYTTRGDKRAAASRLASLVNRYPLYSKADRALWMLGNIWEGTEKKELAAPYYARIVREYPLSPLVPQAKDKLKALKAPVPQPDPTAVAWMTAEKTDGTADGTAKDDGGAAAAQGTSQTGSQGDKKDSKKESSSKKKKGLKKIIPW